MGRQGSLAANCFSGQREAIFPSEVGGGSPGKSYLLREIDGPQRNSDSINFSLKSFQISHVCPQIICSGKAAPRHGKQEGWLRAVEFSEHEEQSKSLSLRTENALGVGGCLASAQGGMVPGPQTNAFSRSTFTSVSRGFMRKLTLVYKGHPKADCDKQRRGQPCTRDSH